jgi:methionyl-tRNA formyltransferase
MKIVIACCKKWFEVDKLITDMNDVLILSEKEDLTLSTLSAFNPEFVFFPHWNWIVPTEIHENFECVVFHTAPLPYGRGGSPIQNLILEKFSSSPVCAVKMTSVLDAGPIYAKKNVSLDGSLTDIFERINIVTTQLILKVIAERPKPTNQEGEVHVFRRLTENDNAIPSGLCLRDIFDRIRMLDEPSYPNAFIVVNDIRIDFFSASLREDEIESYCRIRKC